MTASSAAAAPSAESVALTLSPEPHAAADGPNSSSSSSSSVARKNAAQPPQKPQRPQTRYGAENLSARQFWLIQIALVLGSSIEWIDFSVYGALSSTITPLFFPPSASAATQTLYFWGVFALSFITRPIGAILLGSVGDRWGRRPALLASLAGMAIPTVLIGCLPTYAQAGIAAPILLALLRAIQGLAMGCEFSGAMIYSVELAPRARRGVYGSLTFQSGVMGIAAGNAIVMVLTAALTAAQLSAWGWRLPFLAMAVSALGSFALRMHMPEPRSWEECAEGGDCGGGGGGLGGGAAAGAGGDKDANDAAEKTNKTSQQRRRRTPGSPTMRLLRRSWPQVLLQTIFTAFGSVAFYVFSMWLPSELQKTPAGGGVAVMGAEMAGGVTIAALALMAATSMVGGRVSDACATPRRRLAASCAAIAVGTAVAVPGFLGLASSAAAAAAASASSSASSPAAAAAALRSAQATAALFQVGMLALTGFALGILPSLCADLYKADSRIISFSLAHNLSMSLLGGTAPLVVAAMAGTAAGKAGAAPGVYVAAAGVGSLAAALVLGGWARGALFVAAAAAGPAAGAGGKGQAEQQEEEEEEEAAAVDAV